MPNAWSASNGSPRRLSARHVAIAVTAFVAAVAAVWVTLEADFLAHPSWLAVQKADLILGPVLVGLYWLRARPQSRFGWLLVAFGLLCVGYITQSSSNPWLFGTGLAWESLIYLGTLILILAFPTGRLDGIAAKLILAGGVGVAVLNLWLIVMLPQTGAGGAISGCRELCPENGLAFAPNLELALELIEPFQIAVIVVAAATTGLLIWRIATGTPPQRRALAIGASVALLFLAAQIAFLSLSLLEANMPALQETLQWTFTAARAAVWYGFLCALIAAQLFAARALQRLVRWALHRPSRDELEAMLRERLGDPAFEVRFLDGSEAGTIETGRNRALTVVERDETPAVTLIHDPQLNDDPELLQAAGAVALLAAENVQLDAASKTALDDLRRSRERITQAVDNERRRVAVDLHDGVQQRLGAIRLRLATTTELADDAGIRDRLGSIAAKVDEAIDEVREVSQALYPHVLIGQGLLAALEHALAPLRIRHGGIGRHPAEVESALYYSCLEAVQNATKHGGPGVIISVSLREHPDALTFEVVDNGPGFDPAAGNDGMGLQNMEDRLGGVGGRLVVRSAPGHGTVVFGSVPLRAGSAS